MLRQAKYVPISRRRRRHPFIIGALVVLLLGKDFYQQMAGRNRSKDDAELVSGLKAVATASEELCRRLERQTERIDELAKEINIMRGRMA